MSETFVTVTQNSFTVTRLQVTVTRLTAQTSLKQRRFDILENMGAGNIQNLYPQYSTVTTVTRTNIFKLQNATAMTSAEAEQHSVLLQYFCVLNKVTSQSVREILPIEFLIQQVAQRCCRTNERLLFHHKVMNSERENVTRRRCNIITWNPPVFIEYNFVWVTATGRSLIGNNKKLCNTESFHSPYYFVYEILPTWVK